MSSYKVLTKILLLGKILNIDFMDYYKIFKLELFLIFDGFKVHNMHNLKTDSVAFNHSATDENFVFITFWFCSSYKSVIKSLLLILSIYYLFTPNINILFDILLKIILFIEYKRVNVISFYIKLKKNNY